MKEWLDLLHKVTMLGEQRADRTGVGTRALFGVQLIVRNDETSFPAVTAKQLATKQCFAEMAAFLKGYDNLEQFHELGCTIWDANANASYWRPRIPGDLGRIYGVQWRDWRHHDGGKTDQLTALVSSLTQAPTSRRHVVTAWNPSEVYTEMCLPPCHTMFQAYASNDGHLDFLVTMRSVDLFLGLPFDIAGYALLQRLVAQTAGLKSRRLIFSLGDAHIYNDHTKQVATVLGREPYTAPTLVLDPTATIDNFHPSMARLENYQHHGQVKAEMAV